MRVTRLRDKGTVAQRHEADALLERPGDVVLVLRGVARSVVMACPDGCGDKLTINLDPRIAKAWRFYRRRNQVSIFPSIWRDTGCGSHFIVWNHHIVWCDYAGSDRVVTVEDGVELRRRVTEVMSDNWQHYTEIAILLEEVPWDVNWACSALVKNCLGVEEGAGTLRGYFRKACR